jgi:uncharacterized protein involved in exopolysaccharide biosynthesis/beta-lactamase regulating signal transducer with metallopeptidase domain
MTGLIEALDHPVTRRIGWMLLHTLWQGVLIGIGFALLRLALPKASASVRYCAGCVALALLVASPFVTLAVIDAASPADRLASFPPAGTQQANTAARAGGDLFAIGGKFSFFKSAAEFLGQIAPLLAAIWFVGVLIFSARLSRSCCWLRRLRARNHEPVDPGWIERLDDLRCRLEVSKPVLLLRSTLVEVPTVIGWLRPVILLPLASVAGLSPEQFEAILAHELAHVRRHDYLVNVFQCVVETLLFYHPVAWWISRSVREEREHCCDDLVVKVCGDRVAYARALASLEEARADFPELAFAASGGSLLQRIRRLLSSPAQEGSSTVTQLGGVALLAIGVVLVVAGIFLLTAPAAYQATTRIRIERETPARLESQDGGVVARFYDPTFFQTEMEMIRSEPVLGRVIETLGLSAEWATRQGRDRTLDKAETLRTLRERVALKPISNTTLFEIRVSGETPTEAARIANAIAESYRDYRLDQRLQASHAAIKTMEDRFKEQARNIRDAQANVDKMREELGIYEVSTGDVSQGGVLTADTVRKIEAIRIQKESEYMTEATLLSGLTNLSHDKLLQVLPTASPDALFNALSEHSSLAEQRLVALEKDHGPDHPEVVSVRSQIDDLNKKLNNRAEGILLGLAQRATSLKEGLASLQQQLDRATSKDIERARQTRPYFEAKRKLEELERFGQMLNMKIASEKIEETLPKSTLVQIVDSAVASFTSSAPNRPRGVAMVLFGLILDGVGIGLLRTGRRMMPPPAAVPPQAVSSSAGQP